MKKVFHASELFGEKKEEKALKPIKFTHYLGVETGWVEAKEQPNYFEKIVYLGNCAVDGDTFAAYSVGAISIYKGHLNDGVIE